MTIGDNIRNYRKKAGLTQKKLGEISGTSETTIKQYELGKRQPRLEQLRKIADALEIPFGDIVPFDDGLRLWKNELKERPIKSIQEDIEELTINNDYTIQVNIDRNSPLNIALKKLDDGKPLTEKERQLIKEYVNSDTFRKFWAELPAHFKKLADSIRKSYSLLNAEGKKEAVKQIELADRQIELLTEIPKYRKPNNEE